MKLTTRPHMRISMIWQKNDIIYHNITYQILKLICRYRVISLITEIIGCRLNMHTHWINNFFFIISNFVNLRRLVWKRLFWDHTGILLQYLKAIFTICRLNMWPWKWSKYENQSHILCSWQWTCHWNTDTRKDVLEMI